ncbi:MAG: ABC transporter substrate-binding protein [Xanthobacteraceae bacterium]
MPEKDFAFTRHLTAVGRKGALRRRQFLRLVGGAAIASGVGAVRQSQPVIGFLLPGSAAQAGPQVAAFWQGLSQAGFKENRDVAALHAFGDGQDERLPGLVLTLLKQGSSIIVAGGAASAAAARQSTPRIPIVFVAASAPPGGEFDLNRPAGNMTGVSLATPDLLAERFRNLLTLAPAIRSAAVLVNPQTPNIDVQLGYLNDAARGHGIRTALVNASGEADFAAALAEIARAQHDAFVVANDGFLNSGRARLVALAAGSRMPAAFSNREFVEAGGLLSYGPSLPAAYRLAGGIAARILKGDKPADLPIQNPLDMELALNAKAAGSLGLEIPPGLAAAASEVIR